MNHVSNKVETNLLKDSGHLSESLDGMRGLAAILVFVAHFDQFYNLPAKGIDSTWANVVGHIASYSVMAFFVLSGYVITHSIYKNHTSSNCYRFNIGSFLISRISRIYPPFIFSLILSIAVYYIVTVFELHGSSSYKTATDLYVSRDKITLEWQNYLWNLIMLPRFIPGLETISINGPLWSIFYEWWMYIIAMFFSSWLFNRSIILGALPLSLIIVILVLYDNERFFFFGSIWMIGAICAIASLRKIRLQAYILVPATFTVSSCLTLILYRSPDLFTPYISTKNFLVQFFMVSLLTGLMANEKFRRIFRLKWLTKSAVFSYTLYVIHFPLLLLSFSFFHVTYISGSIVYKFCVFIFLFTLIILVSRFSSAYLENTVFFKRMLAKVFPRFNKPSSFKSAD